MNNEFSIELAKQLVESEEEFPVDLDQAFIWLGYSRKDKAVEMLKTYFEQGVDFSTERGKSITGGRPSDSYYLTTSCLKEFGMIVKTEKGRQIRKYFLECEKIAKQSDPLTNRRNQVVYKGSDILYLDEALKSILDLD